MKERDTKHLHLRPLKEGDARRIFTCWASDPEVTRYLTWQPHADVSVTEAILKKWLEAYGAPDCYRYGIELKTEGELIGMIDVVGYHHGNPVIGYCMGKAYWGNGYMTETLGALVQELLEDGYETIVIEAAEENVGSNRVIQKNGFWHVYSEERLISEANPKRVMINGYRFYKNPKQAYQEVNAHTIDRWIEEGWEWGRPISHETYLRAKAGDWEVLLTPVTPVPRAWFGDLSGKKILGLASGGGQQMPIFAAAGAHCTVLDYSQTQLQSERMVAEREGYEIEIIRADMTKPLPFEDASFDLIFHPVANCYIEEVVPVWKECFRILKPGGVLLAGFDNYVNYIVDENEEKIVWKLPFNPLKNEDQRRYLEADDSGIQFSHTLTEQIGGQLAAGFMLTDMYEDTNGEGRLHEMNIPTMIATRSVKPG